jgi:glycosyltransferase involved in cell wall biosynthesis
MPLVSVVLIFLNEQRFLEEAVQSLRDQTLADWELILVDDGSTDRSTQIARDLAAADERIHYVDHPGHVNRGMSASRNLGAAHASAPYLSFLDADDVWMPGKLAEQLELLESMQDVALVCGARLYWYSWDPASTNADDISRPGGMADQRLDPPDVALAIDPLGRGDATGVEALVRRTVFEAVGGFEDRFHGLYEDQVFLTKVYLRYPVYISSRVWVRYRQHDASCMAKTHRTRMEYWRGEFLDWWQQDPGRLVDVRVSAAVRRARRELPYRKLKASVYEPYDRLVARLPNEFKGPVKRALRRARQKAARHLPPTVVAARRSFTNRLIGVPPVGAVGLGDLRRLTPLSREFGFDRGTPVDRYYIEQFLEDNCSDIQGRVLEVKEDLYATRYGGDRIAALDILNLTPDCPEATIIADLSNAPELASAQFDAIILTQTLQYIFDAPAAIRTLHRILAPGGVLLMTAPGTTQASLSATKYWAFTELCVRTLLEGSFGRGDITTAVRGNVLAAVTFLEGLSVEEVGRDDLELLDPDYPVIITARAVKENNPRTSRPH